MSLKKEEGIDDSSKKLGNKVEIMYLPALANLFID